MHSQQIKVTELNFYWHRESVKQAIAVNKICGFFLDNRVSPVILYCLWKTQRNLTT